MNRLAQEKLTADLRSEAKQQTGTRQLQTDLRSEANQQTGTRELQADLRSEANPLIFHIVKMYKDKEVANVNNLFVNV